MDDVVSAMEFLYMLDTADRDLARSRGSTARSGGTLPDSVVEQIQDTLQTYETVMADSKKMMRDGLKKMKDGLNKQDQVRLAGLAQIIKDAMAAEQRPV